MMFEVSIDGHFVASHQLRESSGTVEPLHDHNWHVTVTYRGAKLDPTGVLVDFVALRSRLAELLRTLDGQNLNRLPAFADRNPSAEHVALHLAGQLPVELPGAARLASVAVEEEPGCVARYFPPPR